MGQKNSYGANDNQHYRYALGQGKAGAEAPCCLGMDENSLNASQATGKKPKYSNC